MVAFSVLFIVINGYKLVTRGQTAAKRKPRAQLLVKQNDACASSGVIRSQQGWCP